SNLVHFFSGRVFEDGAGEAYGLGGLNYYGPLCFDTTLESKCHHAVSQIVPGHIPAHVFHGTAFYQQSLVAHEIGHNNNAYDLRASPVCWLFHEQCGRGLMVTEGGFSGQNLFLYDPDAVQTFMAPLLAEQLESASGAEPAGP